MHPSESSAARALPRGPDAPGREGWSALFRSAFVRSRNAMVLLDEERRIVDANGAFVRLLGHGRDAMVGRPMREFVASGTLSAAEWSAVLATPETTGVAEIACADGGRVGVQWAASAEVVTGRRLVLVVALSTSRWGPRFRPDVEARADGRALTAREQEVVHLIALGHTGREIADELIIADHTVRSHARNASTKLGARSRAHLVALALAHGHVLG
jgi:PAS domain S-box-containing protein